MIVRGLWTCIAYAHTAFPAREDCFEAWSPEKKHWCCTKQGKGCEGHHPPSVDAGYGMVWKHVQACFRRRVALAPHRSIAACSWQVNGYWTWTAVHGHGHASLPYDCHAGMHNWRTGWSPGKKAHSCSRERLRAQRLALCRAGAAPTNSLDAKAEPPPEEVWQAPRREAARLAWPLLETLPKLSLVGSLASIRFGRHGA